MHLRGDPDSCLQRNVGDKFNILSAKNITISILVDSPADFDASVKDAAQLLEVSPTHLASELKRKNKRTPAFLSKKKERKQGADGCPESRATGYAVHQLSSKKDNCPEEQAETRAHH